MKHILLTTSLLFLLSSSLVAQVLEKDTTTAAYPYVLPIWADKVIERGMGDLMQLPFGLSAHYVNAFIDLEITEFELQVAGQDLTGIINTETLNFTSVTATTNGINFRGDAWILPFLNVYGLFSKVEGSTGVSLKPTWTDATGDVILEMPEFSSKVEFDAIAYGGGATLIYGFDNYFMSSDVNFSRTNTELLKDQVTYATLSTRVGRRFALSKTKKDRLIAVYIGAMYRDFIGDKGNHGEIGLDQVFPEADGIFNQRVDDKIAANEQTIIDEGWGPANPNRIKLEAQNAALGKIQTVVNESGLFTTDINYFIHKEMIQAWTFQFGFNFQINKTWAVRGEYGVADSQRFLMTGLQYRFGL
ncbi:hypothetical protein N7E81_00995 [Reichenbachiella carrageenanivorans]|uniref:Porin n=1 Tax=Reichenbachiella carrageenanivorans TaxID=2979869 RepID=A0ABY6D0J7_9BACT|nr:hypothetical protein [Reichenbachiella carrageenanivorans]UXX79687.1 hypothetical protein N7E81_00995 [Reichenbachiella carrageenanivorans]